MTPTIPPKSASHERPGAVSDDADHKASSRVKFRVWNLSAPVFFTNEILA